MRLGDHAQEGGGAAGGRPAGQLDVYDVLEASGTRPPSTQDASRRSPTPGTPGGPGAPCDWCGEPIPEWSRSDAETCGVVCRKRRWRFRQAVPRRSPQDASRRSSRRPAHQVGPAARFAYADPPYPGRADYYPERQEVDHRELVARLEREFPDGWALSTAADALHEVLPLCPRSARVCVWRRRGIPARSRRALNVWEPLLVVGGRPLSTEKSQQLLDVLDYRGRYDSFPGAMVGMKPPEFAVWLFELLGAGAGDELVDLFPGSGAIGPGVGAVDASRRARRRAGRVPPGQHVPRGRGAAGRVRGRERCLSVGSDGKVRSSAR